MRKLFVSFVIGAVAAALKVGLVFSIWALPFLLDVANAAVLLLALVLFAWFRNRASAAVAFTLAIAMLDVPIAYALADARVHDAQRYCEDHARNAASVAGRTLPTLLRPGYSARYTPTVSESACAFPDPFPGRTLWVGNARHDGGWNWERLMD